MSDEQEPQQAILAKGGDSIFGIELRPYSASRVVAAQSMGLLFPIVGVEGMDQMKRSGTYPGMLKDTIIVIWLCALKDAIDLTKDEVKAQVWTPTRATHSPATALEEAMRFAENYGFLSGARFEEASVKMMQTVSAVRENEFVPKSDQTSSEVEPGNV